MRDGWHAVIAVSHPRSLVSRIAVCDLAHSRNPVRRATTSRPVGERLCVLCEGASSASIIGGRRSGQTPRHLTAVREGASVGSSPYCCAVINGPVILWPPIHPPWRAGNRILAGVSAVGRGSRSLRSIYIVGISMPCRRGKCASHLGLRCRSRLVPIISTILLGRRFL